MIIRARPKFLQGIEAARYMDKRETFPTVDGSGFFFSSGRAALKFFLSCYAEFMGRPVKVLLQAFNCTVVRDAVIESGNTYVLCDIGLEDFSVRLETLKEHEGVDVFLLLHYQGIPNVDYQAIADFCKLKNILLIEDLAHGDRSLIKGLRIGERADVRLYSYAFDKPVTALSGGKLVLGKLLEDSELQSLLSVRYEQLPMQSAASSLADVRLLFFLYQYTDKEHYHTGLNYYGLLKMLLWLDWRLLFALSRTRFFKFCAYTFAALSKNKNILVTKLDRRKIGLIHAQEESMARGPQEVFWLERLLVNMGVEGVKRPSNTTVVWNRYSLLGTYGLKQVLRSKGVEVGSFNWPVVLDEEGGTASFPNAERVACEIVNIPVWIEFDV